MIEVEASPSVGRKASSKRSQQSKKQMRYKPPIHVDEIGLTSDKYIPLNASVVELPLKLSYSSMSLQRWLLMSTMEHSLAEQKGLGFQDKVTVIMFLRSACNCDHVVAFEAPPLFYQIYTNLFLMLLFSLHCQDIDDVRRLIADTSIYLLGITMLASLLHLLFEFLAFQSGETRRIILLLALLLVAIICCHLLSFAIICYQLLLCYFSV